MILPETITLDTETTGLTPKTVICTDRNGTNNYIIHMYDDNYEFLNLVPYLNNKVLIGHNILFDLGFMYKYFYPKKVLDTMLASKIFVQWRFWNSRHDFGSCMVRIRTHYDKKQIKRIFT
jgi:ribonuclease D